jgi:hypothetical protein
MIRIESYGDSLEQDEYRCHSRFKRAVNFFNGHSLVALVEREIGPGPHHIVIPGLARQKIDRLAITADEILLDGSRYPFASSRCYDSRMVLEGAIDRERFSANLGYYAHGLRRSAVPQSLAFLLQPKPGLRRRSTLERSLAERLSAGSQLIFNGNFIAGIKMLKGLGFGLTPSGDDFIGGVILALHCGQKIFVRDFERTIRAVCRLASGKNPFSNAVFTYAGQGRAIGKIKDLLAALIYGGEKDVCRHMKKLPTIGHSSGIDFGAGLLLTFQALERSKGEKWW